MKNIIVLFALITLPLGVFAQSSFDKFEDLDDVTTVVINKNMFNLLSKINVETDDKEAQDFMDIAHSLTGLKVFTTDNTKISGDMLNAVNKHLKSSSLVELMRIKDKEANVKFYIKEGKDEDHVKELLMFVTGVNVKAKGRNVETVLLSLTGDIDLNKINSLTSRMNLPKELNKAGKNNK